MAQGPAASPGTPGSSTVAQIRRARFLGQQYADVTKLRELAAKHENLAARYEQRISRLNTRIEKLRHQATLLREKAQKVLGEVPEIDQQIKQHQRDIDTATARHSSQPLTSDVTALHYRVRKLMQKVVDRKQKASSLEQRAAQRTHRTQELKVKVDRFTEAAQLATQEATQYRQRADRLQAVVEQESGGAPAPASAPASPAAAVPSSSSSSETPPSAPP